MTCKKGDSKYAMRDKKNKYVYLQAVTMVYPATGWIEICPIPESRAGLVANQV